MSDCMTISGTVTPIDGRTAMMLEIVSNYGLAANQKSGGAWNISGVCFANMVMPFVRALARNIARGEIDAGNGLIFDFHDGDYGAMIG